MALLCRVVPRSSSGFALMTIRGHCDFLPNAFMRLLSSTVSLDLLIASPAPPPHPRRASLVRQIYFSRRSFGTRHQVRIRNDERKFEFSQVLRLGVV